MRILGCKSTHKKRNRQKFYYLLASRPSRPLAKTPRPPVKKYKPPVKKYKPPVKKIQASRKIATPIKRKRIPAKSPPSSVPPMINNTHASRAYMIAKQKNNPPMSPIPPLFRSDMGDMGGVILAYDNHI